MYKKTRKQENKKTRKLESRVRVGARVTKGSLADHGNDGARVTKGSLADHGNDLPAGQVPPAHCSRERGACACTHAKGRLSDNRYRYGRVEARSPKNTRVLIISPFQSATPPQLQRQSVQTDPSFNGKVVLRQTDRNMFRVPPWGRRTNQKKQHTHTKNTPREWPPNHRRRCINTPSQENDHVRLSGQCEAGL